MSKATTKEKSVGTRTSSLNKPTVSPTKASTESAGRWAFLSNHAYVLIVLNAEPEIVLREVANRVGITERAVQRILQDLAKEGYLRREKVGRRNRYEVVTKELLCHSIESHRKIGDLLKLING